MNFPEWKCILFDKDFRDLCLQVSKYGIPALVQIMVRRCPGHKPLSKPIMVVYWHIYAPFGFSELNVNWHSMFPLQSYRSAAWWIICYPNDGMYYKSIPRITEIKIVNSE